MKIGAMKCGIIAVVVLATAAIIITAKLGNTRIVKIKQSSSASSSASSSTSSSTSSSDSVMKMLEEQGLSKSKLEKQYHTSSGATILGDGLPVKNFKTLNDAETSFGYYLGLHNKLASLSGYQLVSVYVINSLFMQASFDSTDGKKSIVVKTTKKETAAMLTNVYSKGKYIDKINVNGTEVTIYGTSREVANTSYFGVKNGKQYSIHTEKGISKKDMLALLGELINNLHSMTDWVN